ncbi:hypothetical protein [Bradyrhizobium sp. B117]
MAHGASDVLAGFARSALLERALRFSTGYPGAIDEENGHADP